MKFNIVHQQSYSRGELLLRSFLPIIYIPHFILLYIFSIGSSIAGIVSFLSCLFTGKFPRGIFNFQVKVQRYGLSVGSRLMNLVDGYPKFGLNAEDSKTTYDYPYPEKVSQGKVLLRMFFGIFMAFPHIIVLYLKFIGLSFVLFIAWLAVLFTGKYPAGMHSFMVETMRHMHRVSAYFNLFTDTYPPFHGKVLPGENEGMDSKPSIAGVID